MKLGYYPGCTLKTKAANLEKAAMAAFDALGVDYVELDRWNCCGAVFSLADDDLIHHVAPVRNLIRAQQAGCDNLVTICSQCYNTLARANLLVRSDEEKRDTLNRFMDEEPDYEGGVEVYHYLQVLRNQVGWDRLREAVKVPLDGLKVAPFYGCTLVRPTDVAIDALDESIFEDFLAALGAQVMPFEATRECCGSYQMLAHPEEGMKRAATVLTAANKSNADAMVLSCPLCEYNLGTRQPEVIAASEGLSVVPTYYFTQLLGVALGLDEDLYRLDLNGEAARSLLAERNLIAAVSA